MITIKNGLKSGTTEATTLSEISADENLKAFLGIGENVRYVRNGEELSSVSSLESGDIITVEPKANSKAHG